MDWHDSARKELEEEEMTYEGKVSKAGVRCPKHPTYQAAKTPTCGCTWCWKLWQLAEQIRNSLV